MELSESKENRSAKVSWFLTPFKNRWSRLGIYLWGNAMSTVIYKGWAPMSAMLFKSGAYKWQCDETWWDDHTEPCDAQYGSVQTLYTAALFGLNFACLLGGYASDRLGPLITCALGQLLFILGWIMLALSSKAVQMYIPAFILMSSSVSFTAFPTFVACDFFPNHPGLIASLINAAQTMATIIPLVLQAIWKDAPGLTFQKIMFGFTFIISLPTSVILLLALPLRRPVKTPLNDADSPPTTALHPEYTCSQDLDFTTSKTQFDRSADHSRSKAIIDSIIKDQEALLDLPKDMMSDECPPAKTFPSTFSQLLSEIRTLEYVIFGTYYALCVLSIGYYPTTVQARHGKTITSFLGIVTTLLVVPGVILGFLVDYTGTLPICGILVIADILVLTFAAIGTTGLQYATVILHVFTLSFIYTTKLTYIQEIFAAANFGTLVGLMATVTGAIFPINIPIQKSGKYVASFLGYLSTTILCIPILCYLLFRQRGGINYKHYCRKQD